VRSGFPTDQVAGIQRRRIGDVIVTAVNDGFIIIPPEALQGLDVSERDAIYHGAGRRPPFASAINAYLLQWPDRTVLIDTGAGTLMGPDAGKLGRNLESAGVVPADVDLVLITHLHPDHVGGLLTDDGAPTFPGSELMVAEAEVAFWLDNANWSLSPPSTIETFNVAQRIGELYRGRLRCFTPADSIAGIDIIPLPGHTQGHTGYAVSGGGELLVIWGDTCHAPEVQSARPDVTVIFDNDPAQAIQSRRLILERAVNEDLLIAGMHMSFPGFTRIARRRDGYVLQPQPWQYALEPM
jgi:glyoxylase-like metal-dependent hydrolase (beta-lactamase superfamily II)